MLDSKLAGMEQRVLDILSFLSVKNYEDRHVSVVRAVQTSDNKLTSLHHHQPNPPSKLKIPKDKA